MRLCECFSSKQGQLKKSFPGLGNEPGIFNYFLSLYCSATAAPHKQAKLRLCFQLEKCLHICCTHLLIIQMRPEVLSHLKRIIYFFTIVTSVICHTTINILNTLFWTFMRLCESYFSKQGQLFKKFSRVGK
jgi:hypothetical protein